MTPRLAPSHRRALARRTADERGVALVIVMMTITLLTALGTALTLATITETAIAANYRDAAEALYAAEGAVEFVMQELADVPDWSDAISESGRSAFVDGPADGIRTVGAVTLDLTHATRDVNAIAAAPPGAVRAPSVLYAFGRFEALVPSSMSRSRIYVAVWVADRSGEADEDGPDSPGRDVLAILGQAYGPGGSRRTVEVTVARVRTSTEEGPAPMDVLSWRELR